MDRYPLGSEDNPMRLYDLISGLRVAKERDRKIWASLRGDEQNIYEIWPGGRTVAWPKAILEKRRKRQAIIHSKPDRKEK